MEIIKLPAYVTLTNKTDADIKFAPYKENFNTTLGANESIELVAETAGQVFYYYKQASDSLEVTHADAKSGTATYDVCTPAKVTITNNAEHVMSFAPYRENFQFDVQSKEVITFDATTAGQAIYYMNQDVDGALDVTVSDKAVGNK